MVLQQILDARAEADELDAMLRSVADADYARVTQFKGYTIDDVLRHLHQGDFMAMATLKTPGSLPCHPGGATGPASRRRVAA